MTDDFDPTVRTIGTTIVMRMLLLLLMTTIMAMMMIMTNDDDDDDDDGDAIVTRVGAYAHANTAGDTDKDSA